MDGTVAWLRQQWARASLRPEHQRPEHERWIFLSFPSGADTSLLEAVVREDARLQLAVQADWPVPGTRTVQISWFGEQPRGFAVWRNGNKTF
jgi:hypothetical protein